MVHLMFKLEGLEMLTALGLLVSAHTHSCTVLTVIASDCNCYLGLLFSYLFGIYFPCSQRQGQLFQQIWPGMFTAGHQT